MTDGIRDRIQRWVNLPCTAEQVWAEIGGFGDLSNWHPSVTNVEVFDIEGETHRHLTIDNHGLILERLVETGPHHHTYEMIDGPLPLSDHRATLSSVAEPGGCRVFWSAVFEPSDPSADEIIAGFYEIGLRALRERFTGKSES